MRHEQFFTDNPFRRLSTGSEIPYPTIRRIAQAAAQSAKAGLAASAAMEEFGPADLEAIATDVRALANEPNSLLAFRIMWPFRSEAIEPLATAGHISRQSFPEEEISQLVFLSSWIAFTESESSTDCEAALKQWKVLRKDPLFIERLQGFATEDGGQPDTAMALVEQGLLSRAFSNVTKALDGSNVDPAIQYLEAIFNADLGEEAEFVGLTGIAESGDRLAAQVAASGRSLPPFEAHGSVQAPLLIAQVERLAQSVAGRHPSARAWQARVDEWWDALAASIRLHASDLHDRGFKPEALALIQKAQGVARAPELREQLAEDEQVLRLGHGYAVPNFGEEVLPVAKAPALFTIRGIGSHLYGQTPIDKFPGLYYAVLYFTFIFIPVFPITRYIVKPEPNNAWLFLGKTKWTYGMHLHLWASMIAVTIISLMVMNDPKQSTYSPNTVANTSDYSPSYYEPPPVPAPQKATNPADYDLEPVPGENADAATLARYKKYKNLQAESKQLEKDLTDVLLLEAEGYRLETENKALDKLAKSFDTAALDQASDSEIRALQAKARQYKKREDTYNADVRKYNAKLSRAKKMQARYDLVQKLLKKGW